MNKEEIKEILKKYKLINLENELNIKRILNTLGRCNRGKYIYPSSDMYWVFRKHNDFVYTVLDTLEKEKYLKRHILLRCCVCGREKIISTYLMKNEEIICEECGADNDDRDCVVAYEVL